MKKQLLLIVIMVFAIVGSMAQPAGKDLFSTSKGGMDIPPYRIPGITVAQNGRLIATAARLVCGTDPGYGHVDVVCRISDNNGADWSEIKEVAVGTGLTSATQNFFDTAFGDPAIVADRTSKEVLIMAVAGCTVYSSPKTTRSNPNRIACIRSTDNGDTWALPIDQTEQIYSLFDSGNPIQSAFIGGGKIFQSRIVRKGKYYRLYAALCARPNGNRVIYSDDFGRTWQALGGASALPVPGGDEPKCEEMPDGRVIVSSRVGGGRLYNIYTYTNTLQATGSWETATKSTFDGSGLTPGGNATNGEMLVMPVKRNCDGRDMYLALQSLPTGNARTDVGIYYKALADMADIDSVAHFCADWDGFYRVTDKSSAYSSMDLQADNRIGFIYEETLTKWGTKPNPVSTSFPTGAGSHNYDGFDNVYVPIDLETITNGDYSVNRAVNRGAFVKDYLAAVVNNSAVSQSKKSEAQAIIAAMPGRAPQAFVDKVYSLLASSSSPKDSGDEKIGEVVVTGTRGAVDTRHLPQTLTVVDRTKLTENERPNILPTLMEQVPGLMVNSRGMMGYGVSGGAAGGMMLRGISSGAGQMMVLIDGQPQYNGVYGHSIADSYLAMITDRVEVLRGPASLLYGSNAMGGVVNIMTRSMRDDGVKTALGIGAGSYGTFQAEASNQVRKGRFSSTVAMQYGRTDNHRPNMGFEQYGGYAKLNYDINAYWNAFVDFNITHFNSSYPGTTSAPMLEADQWITRGAMAVGVENHYAKTSGRISLYDNFGWHKINDGYTPPASPKLRLFRSKDALAGLSWYQSAMLWKGGRMTIGFDYQEIYGRTWYTNRSTGLTEENGTKQSAHEHNQELAGYVDLRQNVMSWLTFDAGVRYDHHSVSGGEWVPQAGLVIRPTGTGEVKFMASKGFRNPTMKEMYLYPPSNEDLCPERMWNYELSWKQRLFNNSLSYGINLFIINADNIIQTVNRKNVNTGEVHNRGIEVEAQWQINSHWSINTNHAWLHMKHHVVSAPEYKGYIGLGWQLGKWSANAGLMQVCGLFTSVGKDEKKESFGLLNAIVGFKPCPSVKLWVKGDNLLAQRYEMMAGMPMPRATFMGGVNINF